MTVHDAGLSIFLVCAFTLPSVAMALWPKEGIDVVVVGSVDAAEIVARADGALVGLSDGHRLAVARPANGGIGEFVSRLRKAGAHLIIAAPQDSGCNSVPGRSLSITPSKEGR